MSPLIHCGQFSIVCNAKSPVRTPISRPTSACKFYSELNAHTADSERSAPAVLSVCVGVSAKWAGNIRPPQLARLHPTCEVIDVLSEHRLDLPLRAHCIEVDECLIAEFIRDCLANTTSSIDNRLIALVNGCLCYVPRQ